MRGEGERHAHGAQQLAQARGGDPRLTHRLHDGLERAALSAAQAADGVLAGAADAVVLLGEVDEAEVVGEGAQHGLGLLQGHAAQERGELGGGGAAARLGTPPALDGEAAHALLQLEERLPFLLDDDFPQEAPQGPDILAQWQINVTDGSHMTRHAKRLAADDPPW